MVAVATSCVLVDFFLRLLAAEDDFLREGAGWGSSWAPNWSLRKSKYRDTFPRCAYERMMGSVVSSKYFWLPSGMDMVPMPQRNRVSVAPSNPSGKYTQQLLSTTFANETLSPCASAITAPAAISSASVYS